MDLERLTIALRPRTDFEAVDLGLRLAQSHYAIALTLWLSASAPWIILVGIIGITQDLTWLALVTLWWLKPAFERPLLHMFSRVVFGDQPQRSEYWSIALRQPYGSGLFSALTWRRFEFGRTFNLPITQLEGLKGKARRRRSSVLHMGTNGTSSALSPLTLGMVLLAFFTVMALLVSLSQQQIMVFDPLSVKEFFNTLANRMLVGGPKWDVAIITVYWLSEAMLAPFHVAAGFCLYLNRRTHLEAWDVELQFRQLARRRSVAALLAVTFLCGLCLAPSVPSQAQTLEQEREQARERVAEVLAEDNFGRTEERTRWVAKNRSDEEDENETPEWNMRLDGLFGQWFSRLSEILLWTLMAVLLVVTYRMRDRWLPWLLGARTGGTPEKKTTGGLLLSEDELPTDIPTRVRELWAQKQRRDAMSLLYRGALTLLNESHGLKINASDTEGDCERRVLNTLDANRGGYFASIANAWQRLAYGHQAPTNEQIEALCTNWHQIAAPPNE